MRSERIEKYFLASIVDSSQDSIISVNSNLIITSWNKAAAELYGYSADEAIGTPLTELTRDQDLQMITGKVRQVMNNERVEVFDTDRVGKGSKKLNLEVVMSPVRDDMGEIIGVSTIARDITIRREAEKAHRDRELARKVLVAQEDERAQLARDLHDELGQGVTALRFMLRSASEKRGDADWRRDIDEIESVIQEIDRNIDFISWQLRPAALDRESSLTSAINNFTRQWSRHSGIPVKRVPPLTDEKRLLSAVDTNLYRIMQEALNNIQKHAKASEVELSLKRLNGTLILMIKDNGKGVDLKRAKRARRGFGVVGMKERAALIGADFDIESSPGNGTTIYVKVPISTE